MMMMMTMNDKGQNDIVSENKNVYAIHNYANPATVLEIVDLKRLIR